MKKRKFKLRLVSAYYSLNTEIIRREMYKLNKEDGKLRDDGVKSLVQRERRKQVGKYTGW